MRNSKFLFILLIFTCFQFSFSETKVLQNGLEGYSGCEDSYITTTNWGSMTSWQKTLNHGRKTELKAHRESC